MRHIIGNLATFIENLLRRIVVGREVRLCKLLVFGRTDIIFDNSSLFLIRARIDSVQVYPSESWPSIDVLDAESLLSSAVKQKQGIVQFLLVGG